MSDLPVSEGRIRGLLVAMFEYAGPYFLTGLRYFATLDDVISLGYRDMTERQVNILAELGQARPRFNEISVFVYGHMSHRTRLLFQAFLDFTTDSAFWSEACVVAMTGFIGFFAGSPSFPLFHDYCSGGITSLARALRRNPPDSGLLDYARTSLETVHGSQPCYDFTKLHVICEDSRLKVYASPT